MFCPQCSTHNLEPAKFCRACGTNLEVVYLALAGQLQTAGKSSEALAPGVKPNPLEKQGGTQNVVQGSILLSVSLLIGLFGFIVTRGRFPWLVIWTVFFSWMTCWGTISLAYGLGQLIAAKSRTTPKGTYDRFDFGPNKESGIEAFPGTSVTDHTTRQLGKRNS